MEHSLRDNSFPLTIKTPSTPTTRFGDYDPDFNIDKIFVGMNYRQPGLEVVPPDFEEVVSHTDRIEVMPEKEVVVNTTIQQKHNYRWRVAGIFAALVLGAAIGIGLSVGLTKGSSSKQQASIPTVPANASTLAKPLLKLMNDTSIAALEDSQNLRHVFVQNTDASIQHGVYSTNWTWEDIGVQNARNFTPLSAIPGPGGSIYLFYVTTENNLVSTYFPPGGSWQPFLVDAPSILIPQTRQMTAKYLQSYYRDTSSLHVIILTTLSNTNSDTTALHLWRNSTQSFFSVEIINTAPDANYTVRTPCAAATDLEINLSLSVYWSLGSHYNWGSVCSGTITNGSYILLGAGFNDTGFTSGPIKMSASTPFVPNSSDMEIALITGSLSLLYVADQELTTIGGNIPGTATAFPYERIASLTPSGRPTTLYVYHQIDHNTIAEEFFDTTKHTVQSNNITISVLTE